MLLSHHSNLNYSYTASCSSVLIFQAYLARKVLECGCWPQGWVTLKEDPSLPSCTPAGLSCYQAGKGDRFNCTTRCQGMYADITHLGAAVVHIQEMVEKYGMKKQDTAENIYFDKNGDLAEYFGKILRAIIQIFLLCNCVLLLHFSLHNIIAVKKIPYSEPDIFLIYFDTTTFDQIQKDTKMKMETMVGVVGGTMGLLTGFSILSGVEVLYYLCKVFFSMINKKV